MKLFSKLFGVALALIGAGLVTSCSSENSVNDEPTAPKGKIGFIKSPEISIWSGQQNLYGTRAEEKDDEETQEVLVPENEVEVNLAINDTHVYDEKDLNDLVSKLSIHVRYGHDVKVRIPVPAQYVVPVDDMDIVLSHQFDDQLWKTDPESNMVEYTFEELGKSVKLYVDFYTNTEEEGVEFTEAENEKYAEGYICVWTEGIDDEVMEYVYQMYGDGLNFEVYNYYNDGKENTPEVSKEALNGYLNNSTVDFGGVVPGKYVNAFMLPEGDVDCVDHFVFITGESALTGDYEALHTSDRAMFVDGYVTGPHKNGRPYNHIYVKKEVQVY